MYRIKFDGASGVGLYFVTQCNDAATARVRFYTHMAVTDRIKGEPEQVDSNYVEGVKQREGKYWVIAD